MTDGTVRSTSRTDSRVAARPRLVMGQAPVWTRSGLRETPMPYSIHQRGGSGGGLRRARSASAARTTLIGRHRAVTDRRVTARASAEKSRTSNVLSLVVGRENAIGLVTRGVSSHPTAPGITEHCQRRMAASGA